MPSINIWEGALSLVLLHSETGCRQSALNAARLLERISQQEGLDNATRNLCERASDRLEAKADGEASHAGTA